jgi:hypothetical protein
MKKFFLLLIIFTICSSCFAEPVSDDPFEMDLNSYSSQKDFGFTLLVSGVIGVSAGFVSGSTFMTLNSLGTIDPSISTPATITSYAVLSVSTIVAIVGFFIWKDGMDNFLETLRIQAQYNNQVLR